MWARDLRSWRYDRLKSKYPKYLETDNHKWIIALSPLETNRFDELSNKEQQIIIARAKEGKIRAKGVQNFLQLKYKSKETDNILDSLSTRTHHGKRDKRDPMTQYTNYEEE